MLHEYSIPIVSITSIQSRQKFLIQIYAIYLLYNNGGHAVT